MRASRISIAIMLLVVPLPACIGAPPLRVGYGGIADTADPVEPAPDPALRGATEAPHETESAGMPGELRVAVAPRAINPDRAWDLALGLLWSGPLHGPYMEIVWYQHAQRDEAKHRGWRFGPSMLGEGLRFDGSGAGVAFGVLAEMYRDGDSSRCRPGACATSGGDVALGLALRAGMRQIGEDIYAYTTLSLEIRTPALLALIRD